MNSHITCKTNKFIISQNSYRINWHLIVLHRIWDPLYMYSDPLFILWQYFPPGIIKIQGCWPSLLCSSPAAIPSPPLIRPRFVSIPLTLSEGKYEFVAIELNGQNVSWIADETKRNCKFTIRHFYRRIAALDRHTSQKSDKKSNGNDTEIASEMALNAEGHGDMSVEVEEEQCACPTWAINKT